VRRHGTAAQGAGLNRHNVFGTSGGARRGGIAAFFLPLGADAGPSSAASAASCGSSHGHAVAAAEPCGSRRLRRTLYAALPLARGNALIGMLRDGGPGRGKLFRC